MPHPNDAVAFTAVMCLPFAVWVVSRPWAWARISARLEPLGLRVWSQLVVNDEPDEVTLQRWAVERLAQLRLDLDRVRRLLLDDEWMTGTRQVGNRMAFERLVVDVRKAEAAVPVALAAEPPAAQAAPTPASAPRFAFAAPSTRPAVEMIEFGPRGRWF